MKNLCLPMKSLSLLMKNLSLLMKNLNLLMSNHHRLLPHRQSPLRCMVLHQQVLLLQDHLHHHLLIFLQQGRGQEGNRNQDVQHQKASAENQRYLSNKASLLHLEMEVGMEREEEAEMVTAEEMEMEKEVEKVLEDLLVELEA